MSGNGVPFADGLDRLHPSWTVIEYWHLLGLRDALREALARGEILPADLGRVLDFGCGEAPYRPLLSPRAARYVAADLAGNPRADIWFAPGQRLPFRAGAFDVAVSFQVLEHVASFGDYLSECHRVLRDGGRLVLSTNGLWWYHGHPEDHQRWTGFGLRDLLARAGFEVLYFAPVVGPLAFSRLLRAKLVHRVLRRIPPLGALWALWNNIIMMFEERLTPRSWRQNDASAFLLVARRMDIARR